MGVRTTTSLVLGCVLVLWLASGPFGGGGRDVIHPDSTRDWLMAQDCRLLDHCDTAGPVTSRTGIYQGALWTGILALAQVVGGTTARVAMLVVAMWLASLLLAWTVATVQPLRPPPRAPVSALLLVALLPLLAHFPTVLWSPSIMLPFAAVGTLLVLRPTVTTAQRVLAAVLLGAAADLHVAAWPLVFALAGVVGPRGGRAWLLPLGAVLTGLALSPRAWSENARTLQHAPEVLAPPLLALVSMGLRRLMPTWSRAQVLTLTSTLPLAGVAFLHQPAWRYAVPWLAVWVVALLEVTRDWRLPRTAMVTLVALWAVPHVLPVAPVPPETPTYADAHAALPANARWPDVLTGTEGRARILAEAQAIWLPLQPVEQALRPMPYAARAWPSAQLTLPRMPQAQMPFLDPSARPHFQALAHAVAPTLGEPDIAISPHRVVLTWPAVTPHVPVTLTQAADPPYFRADPPEPAVLAALPALFPRSPWHVPEPLTVPPLPFTRPLALAGSLAAVILGLWLLGVATLAREFARLAHVPAVQEELP